MTRLVLGSASEGRRRVLRQAGVEPLVVVSGVDEDAIIAALGADAAPGDVVRRLAEAKAQHVATLLDADVAADCVVIGCDSMLYIDGRLVGKPASIDAARREWQSMGGRSGQLHTGHCLIRLADGLVTQAAESFITTVHFATPTPAIWMPTWTAANRWGWPGLSPWTGWAAGSSTASTATRPTSSA